MIKNIKTPIQKLEYIVKYEIDVRLRLCFERDDKTYVRVILYNYGEIK